MFPPSDLDDAQLEAVYTRHFGILTQIASAEFHIPDEDAEEMAHDVLLAALKQSDKIQNADLWFRGAIVHAAQRYTKGRR